MTHKAPKLSLFRGNRTEPVNTVGRYYLYSLTEFSEDNVISAGYALEKLEPKDGRQQIRVRLFYARDPKITAQEVSTSIEHLVDFGYELPELEAGDSNIFAGVEEAVDETTSQRALEDQRLLDEQAIPMAFDTTNTSTTSTSNSKKDSP